MHPSLTIVLYEPQSSDNVGAVLRAMQNFGIAQLRLVRPAPINYARLEVAAHRSAPWVSRMEIHTDLPSALADATLVVGATARHRVLARPVLTPREVATQVQQHPQTERVALLFGREDHGLPNSALDHCHALLTIPTDPTFPSLNLAQAVLLVAYECFLAGAEPSQPQPTSRLPQPTVAETEAFFATLTEALNTIAFLKPNQAQAKLARLRALLLRARPERDDLHLLEAIFHQLLKAIRRG